MSADSPFDPTLHTPTGATATQHDDEAYCPACNKSYPIGKETCPDDGARLVKLKATRDPLIGRVFDGRYEIRTTLGEGGMGTVYRGWQLSIDREVAIKVVHASIANDRVAVKRFLREARLSSRLSQPSVVNVFDFGQTDDGILYLVMELLRGHPLAKELEPRRPLPVRRVITIALQLCDALEAAHALGIIHRDLKPGNVVVLDDPPGRDLVKVLDFGLAKSLVSDSSTSMTHTNAILGTPLYMSPEQIENRAIDQRADLYALGCMIFHMLAGRPPYLADNATLVLSAHLSDPIPPLPPTTPQALAMLVRGLMAKAAADRPASAALVRDILQKLADDGYGASDLSDTTPDLAPPRAASSHEIALAMTDPRHAKPVPVPARSHRFALVGVAVVGIGVVAFVALRTPSSSPAPDAGAVVRPDAAAHALAPIDASADAPPAIDAALAPVDAGHAPPDAGPAHPRHPDARLARPTVDAAGDPAIDFLPVKP